MMETIKLFCLPHAGGSANAFFKWKKCLPDFIELCPIELAGHGIRVKQPLYQTMEEAVQDLYGLIREQLQQGPYALLGHSMGSLMAYELAHHIATVGDPLPVYLFFSGRQAPDHVPKELWHEQSDGRFLEQLKRFGGLPQDVLSDPGMLDLFLPIIRQDVKILETYRFIERLTKLPSNAAVFFGEEEQMLRDDLLRWRMLVDGTCTLHGYPGGHFFLFDKPVRVVRTISQLLLNRKVNAR